MAVIVEAFVDAAAIHANGIKISSEKYTVVKADEQVIMGRKVLPAVSLQNLANATSAGEGRNRHRQDKTGSHPGAPPRYGCNAAMFYHCPKRWAIT